MKLTKYVSLKEYFDDEDIKGMEDSLLRFKFNGRAILLGEGSQLDILRAIFLDANDSIKNVTKRLEINKNPNVENAPGQIDDNSRDFLIKYTSMNEWILNSTSFTAKDFTGLKDFDKIAIKEQLLKLASLL